MFFVACDEAFRTAVDRPLLFLSSRRLWARVVTCAEKYLSRRTLSSREHLAQGELPKKTLCSPDGMDLGWGGLCLHQVRIPLLSMRLNKSLTGEIIPMTWRVMAMLKIIAGK